MSRTRSKELSTQDISDQLASTSISTNTISKTDSNFSSSPASSPIDVGGNNLSTPRAVGRRGKKEDRSGSISSFSSSSGLRPASSFDNGSVRNSVVGNNAQDGLAVPSAPAIPTTNNILASPKGGLRSSLLGSSPPPSALPSSPGRSSSPTPSGSAQTLSPGAALSATISRGSITGAGGPQVLDVDNMIGRLLEAGYSGKVTKSPPLKNAEIASVCAAAREVFLSQPTLIELSPPVKIVGDVHGQVSD